MPFWTVLAAVLSIASGAVSYIQARKAQKAAKKANDEQRGVLVNKESNIEQIPVIYGERRVGGVRVFVSTDGTYKTVGGTTNWYSGYHPDTEVYDDVTGTPTNEYLYIALVMAEGEVESITDILIDDLPPTDPKYSGLVSWDVFLGTDDQTMPDTAWLREANEFWTADHRLRGVAFLGMRFKWDEEAFSGIPEITAVVKGKKVYDPRTDTTAWSDNPALCIRDYLTDTRYGKGLPLSAIDDVAIAAAANACDESVTLYDGGGSGKLFTCNVVLDTSKTLFDNLNTLLLGCRGFLPYSQGQYRLKIDGSRTSEFTFTNDTIIGGIQIKGESKDEKFNRVTVKFPNPDANWQPDTAIWPPAGSTEETTYLAEDGGVLLHEEIELDTITNYYQARDLARVILLRSRNAITCALKTTSEALQLEVADVVSITHSTPGWVSKPFQVIGMQLNDDGTVDLALLEYDSTIYTWEEGTEQTAYPDTNLPDPFTVAAVSNITITETTTLSSDGTVIPTGLIEWDASYDNLVNQYEIQYKLSSQADTEFKSILTSVPKYEFYNAEVGTSVTIRIRAINSLNVKSAFTTATFTINGDQDAPDAPTSLSSSAGASNIRLDWVNPSASDYKTTYIYRYTSNSSSSATKIASISGESFVDQNISVGTAYYYWVKAEDYSGNLSSFSSATTNTATALTADLSGIENDVASLEAEIDQAQIDINAAENDIVSLESTTATHTSQITNLNTTVGNNSSNITTLQTTTANHASDITQLETDLAGAEGDITANSTALSGLTTRVTTAEGTITSHSSDITSLESTVNDPSTGVSATATAVSNLSTTVTSQGSEITAISSDITTLESSLTTAEGDITSNATAIGGLTTRVTTAEGTITSQASDITTLQSDLTTAEGDITANASAVGGLDTRVTAAEGDITSISSDITTLTTTVNGNTASITTNASSINGVEAKYTVKIDNNGHISGYGLISTANNATPTSTFSVNVDAFKITNATQTSTPFEVVTSAITLADGTTKPAGVYIKTANIGVLNANQLTAGVISANRIDANSLTVSKIDFGTSDTQGGITFGIGAGSAISGISGVGVFGGGSGRGAVLAASGAGGYFGGSSVGSTGYGNANVTSGTWTTAGIAGYGSTAGGFFTKTGSSSTEIANASYGLETQQSIYVGGSYLPFTGSHIGLVANDIVLSEGDILVDVEVVSSSGVSNTLTKMAISSQSNQSATIGIYAGDSLDQEPALLCHDAIPPVAMGDLGTPKTLKSEHVDLMASHRAINVNAVGEGQINVCDEGGDIQAGDLIVTSSTPGKGMKQVDDIIRSYTVAKARESATFSTGEVKQIACIYLCG